MLTIISRTIKYAQTLKDFARAFCMIVTTWTCQADATEPAIFGRQPPDLPRNPNGETGILRSPLIE
jgi:hypothetical protein